MELAQLGTSFVSNNSVHVIKGYVVPFVANLADAHEGTSDRSDLKHRSQVVVVVGQIQGLLANIGDSPTVTHEEPLPTPISRRFFETISRAVLKITHVNNSA